MSQKINSLATRTYQPWIISKETEFEEIFFEIYGKKQFLWNVFL